MDIEAAQRRLATHTEPVKPAEPAEPEAGEDAPDATSEPMLKTVGDVLRFTVDPAAVVIGLKRIGVLAEDGSTMVYKLQSPLAPPKPGLVDEHPHMVQLRFSTVLTGEHVRLMRSAGEGTDNAVALSRVEALTGFDSRVTNRLSFLDAYATMAIAAAIVSNAGNV